MIFTSLKLKLEKVKGHQNKLPYFDIKVDKKEL